MTESSGSSLGSRIYSTPPPSVRSGSSDKLSKRSGSDSSASDDAFFSGSGWSSQSRQSLTSFPTTQQDRATTLTSFDSQAPSRTTASGFTSSSAATPR
jgi:hypothetical protein